MKKATENSVAFILASSDPVGTKLEPITGRLKASF
jgi:hypothetical protein